MKHYLLIISTALVFYAFSGLAQTPTIFDENAHVYPGRIFSYECKDSTYDWVKNGKLIHHCSDPFTKDINYYRYIPNDGSSEIITDSSLASVSEILAKENIQDFGIDTLKNIVSGLVVGAVSARDVYIVDDEYIENYKYGVDLGVHSKVDMEKLNVLLKKNGNEGIRVQRDNNIWKATLYITTPRSGIELLSIFGSLSPITIDKLEREIVYKNNEMPVVAR